MAIVQELYERYFNSRRNACEVLPEVVPENAIVFFLVMQPIFIVWIRQQTKHALLG